MVTDEAAQTVKRLPHVTGNGTQKNRRRGVDTNHWCTEPLRNENRSENDEGSSVPHHFNRAPEGKSIDSSETVVLLATAGSAGEIRRKVFRSGGSVTVLRRQSLNFSDI